VALLHLLDSRFTAKKIRFALSFKEKRAFSERMRGCQCRILFWIDLPDCKLQIPAENHKFGKIGAAM